MSFDIKRRIRDSLTAASVNTDSPASADDAPAPSGLFSTGGSAPPADLVTSDRLKSVRFDLAQPRGYYTEQVDTLVRDLTNSLAWYEEALFQRDKGIHALQTDLDAAMQQEATLRAQIEVFRVQGSVTVGPDGQILRKSQVNGVDTEHAKALGEAKGATKAAEQRLAASVEEVRSLREWADTVIPASEQIAAGARAVQAQLETATGELAAEQARNAEMTETIEMLRAEAAVRPEPELRVEVPAPAPEVAAEPAAQPQAHGVPSVAGEWAAPDSRPKAVVSAEMVPAGSLAEDQEEVEPERNLDDPELPAGVTLPRAKYDREYLKAGPGDPLLVQRRSTLEAWAPELDPENQVASGDDQPAAMTAPSPTPGPTADQDPDDQWGAPADPAPEADEAPAQILHSEAPASDVSDGVARPQLRRQV